MIEYPQLIKTLTEYQLYVCSHILWKMEEEWITDNSQGFWEHGNHSKIYQRITSGVNTFKTLNYGQEEYLESVTMNTGIKMNPVESSNIEVLV